MFLVVSQEDHGVDFQGKDRIHARPKYTESPILRRFRQSVLLMTTENRTRTMFDHYLKKFNITPNIILETENIETLLALS